MGPTPRLVLITVVGTLAYLGLAVVGLGGFAAFFSHPALVVLAIAFFALSGVALFSGGNLSPGVREDRTNRWVIVAFGLIGLLAAYLPAYTDRKGFWTLDGETIRWLGVVLFAAGGALRLWPVFVLGRRFSGLVAIQPGHRLVTSGICRAVRHPSYLGPLVNSLGWALAFRSVVGVLLTALILPPLVARIRAEERLLHARFGLEYDAYCSRTAPRCPDFIEAACHWTSSLHLNNSRSWTRESSAGARSWPARRRRTCRSQSKAGCAPGVTRGRAFRSCTSRTDRRSIRCRSSRRTPCPI